MKTVVFSILIIIFFLTPQDAYACRTNPSICPNGYHCDFAANSCVPNSSSGGGGGSTVVTALGDIPTEPAALVRWILGWAISIGGGIAVLLSLWGGVTIILAGGNPEKINEGKEIITSAISGILFIVFSVFLLRFIGVDILGILKP